ncbi:MAG: GNAT family N-acetyltransferase [Brachybacterium sp.]|nr:GNAT family N-acetyltransferase [Brachybacterium sp.]
MSIVYRGAGHGDMERISALMARAMPRDVVSAMRLGRTLLLEPNHDPRGLVIAEHPEDGVIGVAYGTCAEHGVPSLPTSGYMTLACVDPRHRRRGVGCELFGRVRDHLAERGATSLTVAGYPQAYFWPGVDADEHPEGIAFLEECGLTPSGTAAAMSLDLDAWSISESVRDLERTRRAEGFRFGPATLEDLPEVISFASKRLARDWGEVLREAALRDPAVVRRIVMARDPLGVVVGFATYGAYGDTLERFGPFGIDETRRGTGLGRILLSLTLMKMRSEAAHGAWFLWTGEESPAGHLYASTGFTVSRRFTVMRTDLQAPQSAKAPRNEDQ